MHMYRKDGDGEFDLPLEGGVNFRDFGGYATSDGRSVRRGLLLRSGKLAELTEKDRAFLAAFPVRTILDYRDTDESARAPDPEWGGTRYSVPAMSAAMHARGLSASPRELARSLPPGFDGAALMRELYRELPFANPAYRRMFELLAEGRGLLQHCSAGKDRTGVGCALTLLALGAPVETVRQDYLLTNERLGRAFVMKIFEREGSMKVPPSEILERIMPLIDAREEYIDGALDAVRERYDDFDTFLEKEYGLNDSKREELKTLYLE